MSQKKKKQNFFENIAAFALKSCIQFLGWLKKFGPAQYILGPVKGQGKKKSVCGIAKLVRIKFLKNLEIEIRWLKSLNQFNSLT